MTQQEMKLLYEDEFNRALTEDGSSSSSYITPKTYYPDRIMGRFASGKYAKAISDQIWIRVSVHRNGQRMEWIFCTYI